MSEASRRTRGNSSKEGRGVAKLGGSASHAADAMTLKFEAQRGRGRGRGRTRPNGLDLLSGHERRARRRWDGGQQRCQQRRVRTRHGRLDWGGDRREARGG